MATLHHTDTVAVIGAGAMGAGIAQVLAAAGHPVYLFDAREDTARRAAQDIGNRFRHMAAKGKMPTQAANEAAVRIMPVATMENLSACSLVVEAVSEDLSVKQTVFHTVEAVVSSSCILASNTSSLSITAIASALRHPERLAGLHFFNPAPLIPLVEVVSGLDTATSVADTLYRAAQRWGKTPVHTRSTPGFIVNRVARPFYAESLRLLEEQAADAATIDACLRETGGFRMGALELTDFIGQDVNYAVTLSVWQAFYHDPRFLPSLIQKDLVDAGRMGRKSGRGFYDYAEGSADAAAHCEPPHTLDAQITLFGNSAAATGLAERLRAAGKSFSHAEDAGDERIATAGDAVLYVTDGRTATERAADNCIDHTVVIDLAADYATARRIAVGGARQCDPYAFTQAAALLQAARFSVSDLRDVPALVVMRTVVMLANEAADAVYHGVCTAEAVDAAMKLGVRYPQGPLAWANRIGIDEVCRVLTHLARHYGEDRYRTSPLLRNMSLSKEHFHVR